MWTRSTIKLSKESKKLLAEAQRTCKAVRATCKDVRRSLGHRSVADDLDADVLLTARTSNRRRGKSGGDRVGLS